jgi:hypothetical protein
LLLLLQERDESLAYLEELGVARWRGLDEG